MRKRHNLFTKKVGTKFYVELKKTGRSLDSPRPSQQLSLAFRAENTLFRVLMLLVMWC